jgi:hypothetical protein
LTLVGPIQGWNSRQSTLKTEKHHREYTDPTLTPPLPRTIIKILRDKNEISKQDHSELCESRDPSCIRAMHNRSVRSKVKEIENTNKKDTNLQVRINNI